MPIDPQAVIAAAQAEAVRRANEHRDEMAEYRRKHDLLEEEKADFVRTFLRPATAEDYHEWLHGYILAGGELGHVYDRPTSTRDMYVAKMDFGSMPCLHGAQAIEVILPKWGTGPDEEGLQDIGHSTIYYMDGFRISNDRRPAVYNDIQF